MSKYKNFGDLKKNDFIFSSKIEDSNLHQDCVGCIYNRYIVTDISDKGDCIAITIIYDKSPFLTEWTPKDHDETIFFKVKKDECSKVIPTNIKNNNEVNCMIFATNIEEINATLTDILKSMSDRVKEIKEAWINLSNKLHNFSSNFTIRMNMRPEYKEINLKPQYEEVVTTEAVYV